MEHGSAVASFCHVHVGCVRLACFGLHVVFHLVLVIIVVVALTAHAIMFTVMFSIAIVMLLVAIRHRSRRSGGPDDHHGGFFCGFDVRNLRAVWNFETYFLARALLSVLSGK
jgi:hypothetical protein